MSADLRTRPCTSKNELSASIILAAGRLPCRRGVRMSRCPNCSAELSDEYCPRCGQRRIRPQDLSARHFFHELADEVTDFRVKFKTLHTLRGLSTPGWLTTEYLAGRREPYL